MRNKKLVVGLGGVSAVAAAVALSAGTFAAFTDSEQRGAIATAGTMDLQVQDNNGDLFGENGTVNVPGTVVPGETLGSATFTLKNAGDVAGNLSFDYKAVTNDENGLTDPEKDAGDKPESNGELLRNLALTVTGPDGSTHSLNSLSGIENLDLAPLTSNGESQYTFELSVPRSATSEIQTDKGEFTITANLDQQVRN
ncbi:TasA family protein [Haloactinomyces albus]|uniref:Ribosomally synthesized peptide with SipW-like signal peptide n=1 Tax=Haloactinomyces albus TaxID=1352928 RepID=A0AAE3ZA56_9ACTN|nr:TasA family protein [Haloactinomyces albus]MDR7301158.1 putative ribosomally synthesized peptide with SipW-like signal peptide [Haloactinomyces albus]